MHPLVDITRPFKKYLKTLILNPEEYETPKEMLTEIQKYINPHSPDDALIFAMLTPIQI